jgi:PEP-CTERM motif
MLLSFRAATVLLASVGFAGAAQADPTFLEPTPYLSFADSPFNGASFSFFYNETFEDHLLNTPGLSANAGGVTSVVFGPSIHDSVDADDGAINGSGLNGDDYFTGAGSAGVTFAFNAAALGGLPTSAGLVWTDGGFGTPVTFSAFGPVGELLFTVTRSGFADASNNGETAEDRFFGVTNAAGISAIFMSNASGGMEVDHVQYGLNVAAVPEPETFVLLLTGIGALLAGRRRRRHRLGD